MVAFYLRVASCTRISSIVPTRFPLKGVNVLLGLLLKDPYFFRSTGLPAQYLILSPVNDFFQVTWRYDSREMFIVLCELLKYG